MYSSLGRLQQCKAWESMWSSYGDNGKSCNMHIERDLSLIKSATPGKCPFVERFLSAGTLTQWLRSSIAQGGADPRVKSREQLLRLGVPLQCRKTASKGGLVPSMIYSNVETSKIKLRRAADGLPPLSEQEFYAESKRFNDQFRTLDPTIRKKFEDDANDRRDNRMYDKPMPDESVYDCSKHFHLCNEDEPLSMEKLLEAIPQELSTSNAWPPMPFLN